jgi:hypothetical protein
MTTLRALTPFFDNHSGRRWIRVLMGSPIMSAPIPLCKWFLKPSAPLNRLPWPSDIASAGEDFKKMLIVACNYAPDFTVELLGGANGLRKVIKSKRLICGPLWQVLVAHRSSLSFAHRAFAARRVG